MTITLKGHLEDVRIMVWGTLSSLFKFVPVLASSHKEGNESEFIKLQKTGFIEPYPHWDMSHNLKKKKEVKQG